MADAKSLAGRKFYICATAQATALDAAGYAALTWTEVGGVGAMGESGMSTNILTYDMWNTDVVDKSKGTSNAGDPTLEVARDHTDTGQDLLRTAALTRLKYAFKVEHSDAPSGYTNTIVYHRGLVAGPVRPNGRNEDFDLEVFTLALTQREVVVDPVVIP